MTNLTTQYAHEIDLIVTNHNAAMRDAKSAIQYAIKSGEALLELKEKCERGTFTQIVEEGAQLNMRTAQRYMNAARNQSLLEGDGEDLFDGMTLTALSELHKAEETTNNVADIPKDELRVKRREKREEEIREEQIAEMDEIDLRYLEGVERVKKEAVDALYGLLKWRSFDHTPEELAAALSEKIAGAWRAEGFEDEDRKYELGKFTKFAKLLNKTLPLIDVSPKQEKPALKVIK
jgi:hypothetical protein